MGCATAADRESVLMGAAEGGLGDGRQQQAGASGRLSLGWAGGWFEGGREGWVVKNRGQVRRGQGDKKKEE